MQRLAEAGVERSVGSVGDYYANALSESINGLFKTEVIHRKGPWRSIEAVEHAELIWVDWFNNRLLLEPLGYVPPVEQLLAHLPLGLLPPSMAPTLMSDGSSGSMVRVTIDCRATSRAR